MMMMMEHIIQTANVEHGAMKQYNKIERMYVKAY